MGSLKEKIRQLKEKLIDLGSYKVFTIAMGTVLLPIILEWFGLRLIAVSLVGLYVVAGMIILYNTIR